MNTILFINWSSIAMYVTAFICLGIFIFIASRGIAEMQARSFKVKYEVLKDFINKASLDQENYQAIYNLFNDTYCYSDNDKILVTQLWKKFEFKFRSFFPDTKKNQLPESLEELERNIFSKPKAKAGIHETNIKIR